MFIEFSDVTREEWQVQAGQNAATMYGPDNAPVQAPQPWRNGEWEILEDPPTGLFELSESGSIQQLHEALQSGASSFLVPVDTLYFEEIAKFRALRRIFDHEIRVVAITSRVHQTIYDPHVNLLRATTCAMSAILGGCDALVVRRFDEARGSDSGELALRLARNTQLLLREESGFGEIVDPAAGSWYLESLTQQLIEAARSFVVPKVFRRDLVGITRYVDPDETAVIAVSEGRIATPYEKLRMAAQTRKPRIRLILGRDAKMSRARADFARGVFQSGGFTVAEPADFGVLCAADIEYPAMIAAETKLPVIVAGPETPGAFDFVNLKSDVVAKLSAWHRHLGIEESK